ncbi:hypothetical protein RJ641_014517, partial [Dillenia turbinata]
MNLRYLAYNTSIQESTLTHEYPHVIRNPSSIAKQELKHGNDVLVSSAVMQRSRTIKDNGIVQVSSSNKRTDDSHIIELSMSPTNKNLRLSPGGDLKIPSSEETISSQQIESRSDVCEINGGIRVHGKSSIYVTSSQLATSAHTGIWSIKPYARKGDEYALKSERNMVSKISINAPKITLSQVFFSQPESAGNFFHDFADLLIPLFMTSKLFDGRVKFLIIDKRFWWAEKFQVLTEKLSDYELMDMDEANKVHCFSSMIIGLRSNKKLTIDPSKSSNGLSMVGFTKFPSTTFSLEK